MQEFITPEDAKQQAEIRKKEIDEYVYTVCDATRKILSQAIQSAIQD
jgi:hypothetical protein